MFLILCLWSTSGFLYRGPQSNRRYKDECAQTLQTIPHIEAQTGQRFTDEFKTNIAGSQTEVLRSGRSAQAAALVHDQGPKKEFAVRQHLENLHFRGGVSSGDRQAIVAALIAEGISPQDAERIGTQQLADKATEQSDRAQALMAVVGARGVPTVLKIQGDQITQIDHQAFYGRTDAIAALL